MKNFALLILLLLSLTHESFTQTRPNKPRNNKEQRELIKQQQEAQQRLVQIEVAMMQERILDFHADIVVDSLSKLTVTETIVANAKGLLIQRGIYRMLPTSRDINNRSISVKYDVVSVKKNGIKEPFHTKRENGFYYIYIGDRDVMLPTGVYTYEITYDTYNQIGYFEDFDEVYWNVSGNDWAFEIDTIRATVHLPQGADIIQNACYTGELGSTETNCSSQIESPNTIHWRAESLDPKEGLTVAVGFKKSVVNLPPLPFYLQSKNLILILLAIGAFILLYMIFHWYKHGIDPKAPTVIPQFEPPAHISPADMGYLTSRRYRSNLLPASLISLATKGYIKIIEKEKGGILRSGTFILQKLSKGNGRISTVEHKLMNDLFSYGKNEVELDGTYDSTIAEAVNYFRKSVTTHNKGLVTHGNNRVKTWLPVLLVSIVSIALMIAGYKYLFESGLMALGFVILSIHLVLFLIYLALKPYSKGFARWFWVVPCAITCFIYLGTDLEGERTDLFFIGYLFTSIGFTVITIFSYLIEQPSKEFLQLLADTEGFKMYLTAAENHLIQYFNPPKVTPEVFEKYLPYAVVLGVDDVWGKKFEQTLREHAAQYQNGWYYGSDMNSFNNGISRSLSSGLKSNMSAASTVPGSSSSGSSGGGSSGGGGGGGGGGGW